MDINKIKELLNPTLDNVSSELDKFLNMEKPPKINEGKYLQIILSSLRLILGNPIENPIMRYEDANKYYFDEDIGLANIQARYIDILDLQNYIVTKTMLPFIYDKFTICRMLQLTQNTYNLFVSDANTGVNARDEDICNIFLDIETMLLSDRNASAENSTKNVKAIDNVNKYKKENGGYGVVSEKENLEETKKIITATVEETQKKLANFGFAKQLENKK